MDEITLQKWRSAFEAQTASIQIEFDAFFEATAFKDMYELKVDDATQNLSLEIKEHLPKEIADRLRKLLYATQPEDQV
ncbi:MAG: hypothetical protein ABIX01_11805 [Chitinophagaceae bacterium]